MHSTEALPLPARLDADQYRKLAKELTAAVKSGGEAAIAAWATRWFSRLIRSSGEALDDSLARKIDWGARQFAAYWMGTRVVKDMPPPRPTLAHAQLVIARTQGFACWADLIRYIEAMRADSTTTRFERAVDAVISGDIETLRQLLHDDPGLVRERSSRAHGCTLLHYVSANGVEGYRQKTPPNIVAITTLLLAAGADVDATAHCYGEDDTLGLTATSAHPANAGVMIPMLETLVAAGARINGHGRIVRACLANGQPEAARWLADHGAHLDLADALGVGRLDVARTFLRPDGTLINGAEPKQLLGGFAGATWHGRVDTIDFLLEHGFDVTQPFNDGSTGLHHAAYSGNPQMVELLLARGTPVNPRDTTHHATALEWALWAWSTRRRDRNHDGVYCRVVAILIRGGAAFDEARYSHEGGAEVMEKIRNDRHMLAALRGEMPDSSSTQEATG